MILRSLFGRERARFEACQGICVVSGPGSFSSIRVGVLYANLLSRLLRLPLVGVSVEETAERVALMQRLKNHVPTSATYVAPVYDMEPNITIPRV
jgi:tRNA A37 threonylcarbamoyladenosine modification protein TsaB